jgi:hypothetical protein
MVTVAPGMTALEGSVTVPRTEAELPFCAAGAATVAIKKPARGRIRESLPEKDGMKKEPPMVD